MSRPMGGGKVAVRAREGLDEIETFDPDVLCTCTALSLSGFVPPRHDAPSEAFSNDASIYFN